MNAQEIVERVMTDHWDLAACQCWVCVAGRELGFGPRERYLIHGLRSIRDFGIRDHAGAPVR